MVDPMVAFSRCLHVLAGILLFGGILFIRHVLEHAEAELPEEQREQVKNSVAKRWRRIVGIAIGALIFTGFYNYLAVMMPQHKGDSQYHMWMGMKMLAAFAVFFFASALPGRSKALAWVRKNSKLWTQVTIILATFVVVVAGVLKVRGVPATAAQPEAVIVDEEAVLLDEPASFPAEAATEQ